MQLKNIIDDIAESSVSETEKGRRFELLIQRWLLADPVLSQEVDKVWLWQDFPLREGEKGRDLGIDLVARSNIGEYWAIQCKFHSKAAKVNKNMVDTFLSCSGRGFTDPYTGAEVHFTRRYWISVNEDFNENALKMTRDQIISFHRVDLETLRQSQVDWNALYHGGKGQLPKKDLYDYQRTAVTKCLEYFQNHERGKLIMACGTGKTLTALRIAEDLAPANCLVLVPSIALIGQTLNAWFADAKRRIMPICICSDAQSGRIRDMDASIGEVASLSIPASTSSREIAEKYFRHREKFGDDPDSLIVVFSTYQSIDAVRDAQEKIGQKLGQPHAFDLMICDEAHRTTGIVPTDGTRSNFTKVHDQDFIRASKRLYMTATPRLFSDSVKTKARLADNELCSMDDPALYGEEIHRVGFGYAIANGILTDYKVLVLTMGSEQQLSAGTRAEVRDPENRSVNFDAACKIVGCINGLAKNTVLEQNGMVWEADPRIMRRAIAFCGNIDKKGDPLSSKNTRDLFERQWQIMDFDERQRRIRIKSRHVDGRMSSGTRASALMWLADEIEDPEECRILCNVRCLAEGVDVPALDAAIFLSPRNSQIDVVQAVGRVMRNFRKNRSGEKKYGYIIIPLVVNPDVKPEDALNDNRSFQVLWDILNALRAHDERFNAMINSIALNGEQPDKIRIDTGKFYPTEEERDSGFLSDEEAAYASRLEGNIGVQKALIQEINKKLYARMVEKVGSRFYWERWARDIKDTVKQIISRIRELVETEDKVASLFEQFLEALRASINPSISQEQAIEMLGQHMVTRPVFEALFASYRFDQNNAVTRAMKKITDQLIALGLEKDTLSLDKFYESVRLNLGEVKTLAGKADSDPQPL